MLEEKNEPTESTSGNGHNSRWRLLSRVVCHLVVIHLFPAVFLSVMPCVQLLVYQDLENAFVLDAIYVKMLGTMLPNRLAQSSRVPSSNWCLRVKFVRHDPERLSVNRLTQKELLSSNAQDVTTIT